MYKLLVDQIKRSQDFFHYEVLPALLPFRLSYDCNGLMFWRREPGAKTFSVAAVEFDTGRPRNGLSLGRRRRITEGVHFKGALLSSTEEGEHELLLPFSKSLSLPGKKMQEEYKC